MVDDPNARPVHPGSADGWRATLLAHRPVVNVRLGEEIGHVADIVFDPETRQVSGLLLEPSGRERAVSEMARRVLGGTFGLTYVDRERVISLNADVVTADLEAAPPSSDRAAVQRTRLSAVLGFAVVTMRGRKLGQLADLLLDHAGRHILAYLVEPDAGAGSGNHIRARGIISTRAPTLERPEAPAAGTPQATTPGPAASLTIPASREVRFGRDLIIVAGNAGAGAPDGGPSGARHTAAMPDDAAPGGDVPDASTHHHEQADTPTEQPPP